MAVPTTSMSGSADRIWGIIFRISALSSTTRTLSLLIARTMPLFFSSSIALLMTAWTSRMSTTFPLPRIDPPAMNSVCRCTVVDRLDHQLLLPHQAVDQQADLPAAQGEDENVFLAAAVPATRTAPPGTRWK